MGATGELVAVDTFFAGTLKGVGKVYIQTVLDCFSRFVWARLYTSKMPVTAVQILNNHALPFFEEHDVKVKTILSDNGREYCGPPTAPPRPRHEGTDALRRLQGRDPEEVPGPEKVRQKGGQDRRVELTSARPVVR